MTRLTLLASAATLAAAPVFAQSNDEQNADMQAQGSGDRTMAESDYGSGTMGPDMLDNMIRTSNIVGGDVYAVDVDDGWTEDEWNEMEFVESPGENWEDIGNITDVVLSPDGRQVGLIVSHGGFLDIGDDTVLLTMDDVRRIGTVDALDGDFNYVTRLTEDQIEQMEEVEENWF